MLRWVAEEPLVVVANVSHVTTFSKLSGTYPATSAPVQQLTDPGRTSRSSAAFAGRTLGRLISLFQCDIFYKSALCDYKIFVIFVLVLVVIELFRTGVDNLKE